MTDPISNERLLPCPFCGASGDELMMFCDPIEGRDNSGPSRRIQCACCNIEAPFYDTKAEAIAAWNRRQPPAGVEPVAWQCFDCIMEQWSVIDDAELAAARSRRDGEWIVRPLYASPPKAVTATDEMVERAAARFVEIEKDETEYSLQEGIRELLTAALSSEAHNGREVE